jgi:hypothetical protein
VKNLLNYVRAQKARVIRATDSTNRQRVSTQELPKKKNWYLILMHAKGSYLKSLGNADHVGVHAGGSDGSACSGSLDNQRLGLVAHSAEGADVVGPLCASEGVRVGVPVVCVCV